MLKEQYLWYPDASYIDYANPNVDHDPTYAQHAKNYDVGTILRVTGPGMFETLDKNESIHGCGDLNKCIIL